LEAKPTENLEAYKAYLRGLDYFDVYLQQDNLKQAIQMFELAVKLDPEFALAYGYLSRCHSLYYHFGYDRTEERMSEAKMAVDRMKELQPNLPEFHLAFGVYLYRCLRKYDRALEELSFAEQGLPNNVEILNLTAFIRSRQGNFIESIRLLKRSLELDPKNAITAINLGQDFMRTRDFLEAEHYFDLTISLAPNQILGYPLKALTLFRSGKEGAREVIESMPRSNDPLAAYAKYIMEMADKNYQAALDIISPVPVEVFTITETFVPKALLEGQALLLMGKMDLAKAAFRDALLLLESEVKKNPQDPSIRSALGLLYADLGRKEDALREGQLAMEICPVSFDAFSGPEYVINYARILAKVGEHEEALDKIDYLLSIPSSLTVRNLQNGSGWAPLHGHPRFKQIIEKYSK
jgi:tetratricopeptide (TPR) repeat protein